jgi:hypothetical protein
MCSRRSTRVFDDRHELVDGELEPRMRESFTDFVHVDAWGHLWTGPTA